MFGSFILDGDLGGDNGGTGRSKSKGEKASSITRYGIWFLLWGSCALSAESQTLKPR